jgi:hypothetical protein
MSTWQLVMRFVRAPSNARNRPMMYATLAWTGFQLIRRMTQTKERSLLTFEVRPGETYEITGLTRKG